MIYARIRTWLLFIALYIFWTVICFIALFAIIVDPIKLRVVQPLKRIYGKVSIFIMMLPHKISGQENVKDLDRAVVVSNHTSAVDIPMIMGYVPLRIGFFAKKEIMYVPLIGQIFFILGNVVVDRSNPRSALKSIDKGIKAYKRGISMTLFPEGTRSRDGSVGRFKGGSLRIPVQAGAPVVPVSIYGGHEVMRKKELIIRRKPIYMHIGEPISSEGVESKEDFRNFVQTVEDAVRANTLKLKKQMEADHPTEAGS